MISVQVLAVAGVVALVVFLTLRKDSNHDHREPPLSSPPIPVVGHLVGMFRNNFNYFVQLSQKTTAPIFTVALPGQKMYIVKKPDLIQKVQKQHEDLNFTIVGAKFTAKMCGVSKEGERLIHHNFDGSDKNSSSMMGDFYSRVVPTLKPGKALDELNLKMIREISNSLDALEPARGHSTKILLNAWVKKNITSATTRAVYGPQNPFEDQAVVDGFWTFEKGIMSLLVAPFQSIFARKAAAGRDVVARAFGRFFKDGVENASDFAKVRYNVIVDFKTPWMDGCKFECSGAIAFLVNTVPATFWTLLLIHSNPILADIRNEIDACVQTKTAKDGTMTKILDIATVKERCPLLLSAYQEALRHRAMGTGVREVLKDTYLGPWLLKKGGMVQMPSAVVHSDAELWGEDVAEFQPRRFLPENKHKRAKDVAFRAFGGGKHLCPGRHFATNEVLATVAVFIARFDMKPSNGRWEMPTVHNTTAASVLMEPDYDVGMDITTRPGVEGAKWDIKIEADKIFAMVTEDTAE